MSELEPPPDALQDLFAAEKARPVVDVATRAAVRARVAAAVGSAPLGAAAAGGGIAKALATVALVVAAGAGTFAIVKHARSGEVPVGVVPRAEMRVVESPAPAPVVLAAPVSPPPVVAPDKPRMVSQAELLRAAWTALSAGDAARAQAIIAQDSRLHPDGALAEERAAVEVLALAQLHRTDEARAAGARFIAHYPTSVHRARIETTLQEMP